MDAFLANLAAPVAALFTYNRGNFMYDRGQDLTKKYQAYTFKVNQFGLYREDIRDLVALTIDKTNNYQVVVALELGFIIALIGPARLPQGTPDWITWLTFASLCESVIYLTLALWFASHASISASSYGARLLTQHVRLPVPSDEQLAGAVTRADDFEGAQVQKMLRMPFLKATFRRLWERGDQNPEQTVKDMVTAEEHEQLLVPLLTHIRLYRKLQQYWLNFDAYSRISLAVGTYSMLKALSFYSLGYYVHEMRNLYAGIVGVIIFTALGILLMTLDMILSTKEVTLATVLFTLPSLTATVGMIMQFAIGESKDADEYWKQVQVAVDCLVPVVHFSAAAFMLWVLQKAIPEVSDDDAVMPIHFRLIHFLDMFKNFRSDHTHKAIEALHLEERDDMDPALAKMQAEGALTGAMDEWKGKKNTARVMALLEIALDLGEAAGLPEEHPLVRRAALHIEELKIINALQKERRMLQMLQAPGFLEKVPADSKRKIETLYGGLTGLAGMATDVKELEGSTHAAWFHVHGGTPDEHYLALTAPHTKTQHVPASAVVLSLEMIEQDVRELEQRQRDIIKLHSELQEPSLRQHLTTQTEAESRTGRRHRWFREDPGASKRTIPLVEVEDNTSAQVNRVTDKYSVGNILAELGSAFVAKKSPMGVDDERRVASLFPWRMFRTGTFVTVAVWIIMGILRCFMIHEPFKKALQSVTHSNITLHSHEHAVRRRLFTHQWDTIPLSRIHQPLFDPASLACNDNGEVIVGNSYMAYSSHDGERQCWHEHGDLAHVDGNVMALSVSGTQLVSCTEPEVGDIAVDTPLRHIDVRRNLAVGIPKAGNGVYLLDRLKTGFHTIAALSDEAAIDVAISDSYVYALFNNTVFAWRLNDTAMRPEHVLTLDTGKEYVGFCVSTSTMHFLERQDEKEDIITRTLVRKVEL